LDREILPFGPDVSGFWFESSRFKGIVHPKMKIHFHSIIFSTIEVNGAPDLLGYIHSSNYLPLCSAEKINIYRFGTT